MKKQKTKIGIALSGGGALGIAHLGVLQALEENGIIPDEISGTSMGALVGVLYAAGTSPLEILREIKRRKIYRIVSWKLPSNGFFEMGKVEGILKEFVGDKDFESLNKKFHCAVTNLNSGEYEVISEGKLIPYVLASASIPILFEPQVINEQTYVDGGLLNNLPVEPLVGKVDVLIGVHVTHVGQIDEIRGMKQISERCLRIVIGQSSQSKLELCDFLLEPEKLDGYSPMDFAKADEIYQIGYNETKMQMEEIHRLCHK
ncbi:patatin-like phospholipase family protein [Sunxiuqinia indica]|uniref:patatin-like phospholipase family protein n=1 Tax=Sunxiuqinia indica TaxID=2692584 RepID=UPI0013576E07|nr:patatin-like phospholipase family protein [Sunxiuqinia indica]